ncbi:ABC transporter permease [Schaalia canis]|uniref:ABC transporter permease n=1 Tax=Schaalia canis TaxID=100469 RepID=A0A3P1SGP0_9ACTO|nr:ABC transporter permease [Schaalia canis]RRC96176.1 ABC transporter permease [Schaalia canis]
MATRVAQRSWMTVAAPLILLTSLLAAWTVSAARTVEEWRLPSPWIVSERFLTMLTTPGVWRHLAVTAAEAALGSFIGAAIAFPTAYLIYRNCLVRAAVEPFLGATQSLPAIALAPLLVLWVGYGTFAIALLCALIVFFPILISTVVGLRTLDREVLEAASLDGASGWVMLARMELPLAAPSILAGMRNGFTLSITGAIVGEMVMGGDGLGQLLVQSRNNLDTAGMFATIALLCVLSVSIYQSIRYIESRYLEEG